MNGLLVKPVTYFKAHKQKLFKISSNAMEKQLNDENGQNKTDLNCSSPRNVLAANEKKKICVLCWA